MTRPGSISLFIPLYNEIDTLDATVERATDALARMQIPYELILVDDGSTDGSRERVDALAAADEHIRALHHDTNLNYGRALTTGFRAARYEAVGYTDADLPVDLARFDDALALLDDADFVSGYRIARKETLRRAVYSRIYNGLMRLLFGVRVRDVNFSFKLVRTDLVRHMRLDAHTVFIDGQLLAEATRLGARIVETPVEYFPRTHGKSSFDSPVYAWRTLVELLRNWMRPAPPTPSDEIPHR